MTDVSLVNRQVPNFLDNIPDQNANASGKTKVMLDADGRITESNESRGHIFGKAINQTLTEKTQVSVNPNSRGYLLTTNTHSATILYTGVTHRQD